MSGHVFHPGHAELHGITVVVETLGDALYVGRYHEETPKGLLLHDVAEHRPDGDKLTRDEFIKRTLKFGVRAEHRNFVLPTDQVRRITKLVEWEQR
ncbi:MAG: hypothetical protein IPK12_04680 [Gemmatimonadetes bacterium]|nr:hypothetical protein [Gemmatimonadota bacterium]